MREQAIDIIKQGTTDGDTFFLPPGQLDRKLYVEVDKLLKGFSGKWNRKTQGHIFPYSADKVIAEITGNNQPVNRKKELQFFETPDELADTMVGMAGIEENDYILEPQAGHGRIIKAIRRENPLAAIASVEIDHFNCEILRNDLIDPLVHEGDFLEYAKETDQRFDKIIMNPPFAHGQDIQHIRAAYDLLKDKEGSCLVAVCSESAFTNTYKRNEEFLAWLHEVAAFDYPLPTETFKESGTEYPTRLIEIRKWSK